MYVTIISVCLHLCIILDPSIRVIFRLAGLPKRSIVLFYSGKFKELYLTEVKVEENELERIWPGSV